MNIRWLLTWALLSAALLQTGGQNVPAVPPPDDRYKADILLVVAHPDDDTDVSTYLWKAVLDQGKRVAVVFTTRGNSGGNAVGMEQSKTLAAVREIEARRSLAARGITNVWFLHGSDTPTQDVLHSLEILGHGEAIEEVVRIIRLTRPEVILTWLPAYVDGENHGDHQAAAVIATEAFDLAGSPAAFPEQIAAPRDRLSISNYGEGLHAWQAKKLYFFSDASQPEFLAHHGPSYLATDICRSKGVPFSQLNRLAWNFYRTQIDFNEQGMLDRIDKPVYLVQGKLLVTAPLEGDVLGRHRQRAHRLCATASVASTAGAPGRPRAWRTLGLLPRVLPRSWPHILGHAGETPECLHCEQTPMGAFALAQHLIATGGRSTPQQPARGMDTAGKGRSLPG